MAETFQYHPEDLDLLRSGTPEESFQYDPSDLELLTPKQKALAEIPYREGPVPRTVGMEGAVVQGMLGGYAPETMGAIRTGVDYLRGEPTDYRREVEKQRAGLEVLRENSPIASRVAEVGGTFLPSGLALKGVNRLGQLASKAAPELTAAVQAFSPENKLARGAAYLAKQGARGAIEGATVGAVTAGTTEAPLSEDVGWGAALGGIARPALGVLFPGPSSFKGSVTDLTKDRALSLQKRGVPVYPHQIVESGTVPRLAAQHGVTGDVAQLEALTKESLRLAGIDSATAAKLGIRQGVIDSGTVPRIQQHLGQKYEDFAQKVGPIADSIFEQGVIDVQQNVNGYLRAGILPANEAMKLNKELSRIADAVTGSGLTGKAYRDITAKKSPLTSLLSSPNASVRELGYQIKSHLDSALDRAAQAGRGLTEAERQAYLQLNRDYKNFKALERPLRIAAARGGGHVDPNALSSVSSKSGEVRQFADEASILRDVQASPQGGTVSGRPEISTGFYNKLADAGQYLLTGGAGMVGGGGFSRLIPEMETFAPGVLGPILGGMATVGTKMGRDAIIKYNLRNPETLNRLLGGKPNVTGVENIPSLGTTGTVGTKNQFWSEE